MHARIVGELGMERAGEDGSLTHRDRMVIDPRQHLVRVVPEYDDASGTLSLRLHDVIGREVARGESGAAHLFQHTLHLVGEVGDTPRLFQALQGLSVSYALRGQFRTAEALIEQRRQLAERLGHPAFLPQAHIARGHLLLALGEAFTVDIAVGGGAGSDAGEDGGGATATAFDALGSDAA